MVMAVVTHQTIQFLKLMAILFQQAQPHLKLIMLQVLFINMVCLILQGSLLQQIRLWYYNQHKHLKFIQIILLPVCML